MQHFHWGAKWYSLVEVVYAPACTTQDIRRRAVSVMWFQFELFIPACFINPMLPIESIIVCHFLQWWTIRFHVCYHDISLIFALYYFMLRTFWFPPITSLNDANCEVFSFLGILSILFDPFLVFWQYFSWPGGPCIQKDPRAHFLALFLWWSPNWWLILPA